MTPLPLLRVATMNLRGIHTKRAMELAKLDLRIEACATHHIDALLGQETWEPPGRTDVDVGVAAAPPSLPPAWVMLSSPSRAKPRRRGLMIIANQERLSMHGLRLEHFGHLSNNKDLEFLVAQLGLLTLVSTYLPTAIGTRGLTRDPGPCIKQLAEALQDMRPNPCGPLLLAGDFTAPSTTRS